MKFLQVLINIYLTLPAVVQLYSTTHFRSLLFRLRSIKKPVVGTHRNGYKYPISTPDPQFRETQLNFFGLNTRTCLFWTNRFSFRFIKLHLRYLKAINQSCSHSQLHIISIFKIMKTKQICLCSISILVRTRFISYITQQ